jgi:hypothetical protein
MKKKNKKEIQKSPMELEDVLKWKLSFETVKWNLLSRDEKIIKLGKSEKKIYLEDVWSLK